MLFLPSISVVTSIVFDGQILWPGCEDTYGYGTNDSNSTLGPREEVNAFFGLWESTGSVFDPDADGDEDHSSSIR